MNDTVDASSEYQDSLPISSDAIMEQLDNWGITYTRSDHVPLRTVEESKKVQGQFEPYRFSRRVKLSKDTYYDTANSQTFLYL
jgi:hypothetical protein